MSVPAASVIGNFAKMNFKAAPQTQAKDVNAFLESVTSAINAAWTQWVAIASLGDVIINANIGTGGRVMGPELGPFIQSQMPPAGPFVPHWKAVAKVLSSQWNLYQNSISVPGLPLWPTFAAVPAPQAPPTPNIPVPLLTLKQDASTLGRGILRELFLQQMTQPSPNDRPLFDALAAAIETSFKMWQTSTTVKNVMGTGPVPTFAPPYVPVGQVVGGVSLRVPGTFS
jgi:hypothetical protein